MRTTPALGLRYEIRSRRGEATHAAEKAYIRGTHTVRVELLSGTAASVCARVEECAVSPQRKRRPENSVYEENAEVDTTVQVGNNKS